MRCSRRWTAKESLLTNSERTGSGGGSQTLSNGVALNHFSYILIVDCIELSLSTNVLPCWTSPMTGWISIKASPQHRLTKSWGNFGNVGFVDLSPSFKETWIFVFLAHHGRTPWDHCQLDRDVAGDISPSSPQRRWPPCAVLCRARSPSQSSPCSALLGGLALLRGLALTCSPTPPSSALLRGWWDAKARSPRRCTAWWTPSSWDPSKGPFQYTSACSLLAPGSSNNCCKFFSLPSSLRLWCGQHLRCTRLDTQSHVVMTFPWLPIQAAASPRSHSSPQQKAIEEGSTSLTQV